MMTALSLIRRLTRSRPARRDWVAATDMELAVAARGRDREAKEAFVEIVRRHQAAVCAVAWSVAGRLGAVDDIAQETFLRAWKRLATLREPGKLKAWLTRIAHDCAVDAVRKEHVHDPLEAPAVERIESGEPAPDKAAAAADDEAMVWSALAALPEALRTPLVMFYREGRSVAAVAAAMELSEDAVKQRLSRGREALRESVAAKIEGVLARTGSPALLICAVAAAIGLLTTPAALAAGAFSAASAAGAGTAGGTAAGGSATVTSTSTFSTAMTASSWLVATLTMAAFIPLGWKAREPEPGPAARPPSVAAKPIPKDPYAAWPDSELLRAWRRLCEEHGTGAAAMPVIHEAITGIKDDFRRRALRSTLLAEWASVDPSGAFDFLLGKKQTAQAQDMVREWLRLDPSAAADYLIAQAGRHAELIRGLLPDLAESAPGQLLAAAAALPNQERDYPRDMEAAFAVAAARDPAAARAAAESLSPGTNRNQALAGVARKWAEKDGAAALAWAKGLPEDPARADALRNVILGWAKTDPAAALNHLTEAPAGQRDLYSANDTASAVLRVAAEKNFEATLTWLAANSGSIGQESWRGLSDALGKRLASDASGLCSFLAAQPESMQPGLRFALEHELLNDGFAHRDAIRAWAKANPSPLADQLQQALLGSAAWNEPSVAMAMLADFPDNPQGRLAAGTRLSQLLTEPRDLASLEALIAQAPEHFRGQLLAIAAAGQGVQPGDLAAWTARIEQLPEEERGTATANLAGRMAAIDPQEAITRANALPDNYRAAAMGRITATWAADEPEAASRWVRDLPAGPERDAAAGALSAAVALADPEAAWAWAASVSDRQEKLNACSLTATVIRQKNPALLQRLLDSGPADPDIRTVLENVLGTGRNHGGGTATPPATFNGTR